MRKYETILMIRREGEGAPEIQGVRVATFTLTRTRIPVKEIMDGCSYGPVIFDAVFITRKAWETDRKEAGQLVRKLYETGIPVYLEGNIRTRHFLRKRMIIGGRVFTRISISQMSALDQELKRILDVCGACAGLLIAAIVILIFGPVIRALSPGPVVFQQTRIGKHGKPFTFYKIRTMRPEAETERVKLWNRNTMDGYMFKLDHDPRIIPGIGEFLRRTSLDEFPQFWNVLKGDMSIVGARPPLPDEYEKYLPHHKARLAMKPGITGAWQVAGRNQITDFEEVVRLDVDYIKHWSFGRDIRIILQTISVVAAETGAK